MNKYDGLYIFVGAAKDETLEKSVDKVRGEITRLSGVIIDTQILGKRTFARPMRKRENGVYVRIRFELDPLQVSALTNRYHLMEELFRVQILAVDERREQLLAEQAAQRRARAEAVAAEAAAHQVAMDKAAAEAQVEA